MNTIISTLCLEVKYVIPDKVLQAYATLSCEIFVRIGPLKANSKEISDYLPLGLKILINNIIWSFPSTDYLNNKARIEHINCTKLFIRNSKNML